MELNTKITDYLLQRGLTKDVIERYGLSFNGVNLVIPVYLHDPQNPNSKVAFNKYRKNPYSTNENEPKYRYDKGSYARLYNEYDLEGCNEVIIAEGELDTLLLISKGYNAVTSTGGCLSFKETWAEKFEDKEVYVCFDKDESGVKAAIRMQTIIPHAKIIWLPEKMKGKDVTDFFEQYENKDFDKLIEDSESYILPNIKRNQLPELKTELKKVKAQYNGLMNIYNDKKNEAMSENKDTYFYDSIVEELQRQLKPIEVRLKRPVSINKRTQVDGEYVDTQIQFDDLIKDAKNFPITDMLEFNNSGFTHCIFHNEKTPSMKYYPDNNTCHCFGGCGTRDAIDIYMQLHDVEFKKAVLEICKKI